MLPTQPVEEDQNPRIYSFDAMSDEELDADIRRIEEHLAAEDSAPQIDATQPIEREAVTLGDDEEEFLVHLLDQVSRAEHRRQDAQDEQFKERRISLDNSRLRFYLSASIVPPFATAYEIYQHRTYSRMLLALGLAPSAGIERVRRIRAGSDDDIGGDITDERSRPLVAMMSAAIEAGMNFREAIAFMNEWFVWLERTGEDSPHIEGFLDVRILQFWAALRRGWGAWYPSQRMLDEVRDQLLTHTTFDHERVLNGMPQTRLRPILLDSIRDGRQERSALPAGEQARLVRLLDDGLDGSRVYSIFWDWETYISTLLASETNDLDSRLHREERLERLIRQERVINARRGFMMPTINDMRTMKA
jgi:hypothetical protein